jgi:hypothetical protein
MSDPQSLRIGAGLQTDDARTVLARAILSGARRSACPVAPCDVGAAMKRYTVMTEPSGHPEARREMFVEACDELAPVPGVTFPASDGGKYRQIMVDIDPLKLQAAGLTPTDVVNAVNAQNLTLPSGLAKIGNTQYTVRTNAMPLSIEDLNNIPVKYTNGQTVLLKDVGQVHDGWVVQQNIVRNNGQRSVLLSVLKKRQCVHRRRGRWRAQGPGTGSQGCAAGDEHQRAVRSIEARDGVNRRRATRRRDRCRAHRIDDPIVSRLVALDPYRFDLDPAVDPS